jgi:hypothetical protein
VEAEVRNRQRVERDLSPPAGSFPVRFVGLAVDDDPRVSDFERRGVEVEEFPLGAG